MKDVDCECSIQEMEGAPSKRNDLVSLQMVMVTSSMNHEYSRKALEKSQSMEKREVLLTQMSHLKSLYFEARTQLANASPERLEKIENELRYQKMTVFSEHSLH